MAATAVEFPEPAEWLAVALGLGAVLAQWAAGFPADFPVAAEASGWPAAGSVATGPAAVVLVGR
jgi:hypothetical protein